MSVYVDDMRAPFGRMVMCHMIADSSEELHAMAAQIGVARRWCQDEGNPAREHYDVSLGCRAKAIAAGSVEITQRELAMKLRSRRAPRTCASETAGGVAPITPESLPE